MNSVVELGRMTADPEIRTNGENTVARFTIAVDRYKEGTDFIKCVAFGKTAEFVEKYCKKGKKYLIDGRIQTGSYTNKEGKKVYTTDVVAEHIEFADGKDLAEADRKADVDEWMKTSDGFMNIPVGIESELPFN